MEKILNYLKRSFHISTTMSSVDTAVVTGIALWGVLIAMFGLSWPGIITSTAIAIAFVLGTVYILDIGLHQLLPDTAKAISSGEFGKHKALYSYLILVILLQGGGSAAITWVLRHHVSHVIIRDPQLMDDSQLLAASSMHNATIASAEGQIKEIKQQQRAAEKAAVNSALTNLAANGNAWAKSEITRLKKKAALPYQQQLAQAQATLNSVISTKTDDIQRLSKEKETVNRLKLEGVEKSRRAASFIMMALALGALATMFISAIGMGLLYGAYQIGDEPVITKGKTLEQYKPYMANGQTVIGFKQGTPLENCNYNDSDAKEHKVNQYGDVVYTEREDGAITRVEIKGKPIDERGLKEYIKIYGQRAEASASERARTDNAAKTEIFQKALQFHQSNNVR